MSDIGPVRPDDAFERFFGLRSLREVDRQRRRADRCLAFDGARTCLIAPGAGLYTPAVWP